MTENEKLTIVCERLNYEGKPDPQGREITKEFATTPEAWKYIDEKYGGNWKPTRTELVANSAEEGTLIMLTTYHGGNGKNAKWKKLGEELLKNHPLEIARQVQEKLLNDRKAQKSKKKNDGK